MNLYQKKERSYGKRGFLFFVILMTLLLITTISATEVECSSDDDCDDLDLYTYDQCHDSGTVDSFCTHLTVNCVTDNDCGITGYIGNEFCEDDDVYKEFQESTCHDSGTLDSECEVVVTSNLLTDCGEGYCEDWEEDYCEDGDVHHVRICHEQGCYEGGCFSGNPYFHDEKVD